MFKDKTLGKDNTRYCLYDRPDLKSVVMIFFDMRKVKETQVIVASHMVVSDYVHLHEYMTEDLNGMIKEHFGEDAGSATDIEYGAKVTEVLKDKFLTRDECVSLVTTLLGRVDSSPQRFFNFIDRSRTNHSAGNKGGLICLYGGSGSGKTTFIDYMLSDEIKSKVEDVPFKVVYASEPTVQSLPLAQGLCNTLCLMICEVGLSAIGFDSFRGVVYGSGGATLSGGVSAAVLEVVMNLSRISAALGKLLLGVINPLNTDEQKNETLVEALLGSSTGLIRFSKDRPDTIEFSHRYMEDRSFKVMDKNKVAELLANAYLPDSAPSKDKDGYSSEVLVMGNGPLGELSALDQDITEQLNVVSTVSADTDLPTFTSFLRRESTK